jgi:hypothetical protein
MYVSVIIILFPTVYTVTAKAQIVLVFLHVPISFSHHLGSNLSIQFLYMIWKNVHVREIQGTSQRLYSFSVRSIRVIHKKKLEEARNEDVFCRGFYWIGNAVCEHFSTGWSNRFDKECDACFQCCSRKSTVILLGKEKYRMMLLSLSPVVAPITAYLH